jgi:hypothetical protein
MSENLKQISKVVDTLENIVTAINMTTIPDPVHVSTLRDVLPEQVELLKEAVLAEIEKTL